MIDQPLPEGVNLERIAAIGYSAALPEGYHYGADAMDNVKTGQRLATEAIVAELRALRLPGGSLQNMQTTQGSSQDAVGACVSAAPPEGWVMVPREPTDDMLGRGQWQLMSANGTRAIWTAMLSAAPAAPPTSEVPSAWRDITTERRRQIEVEGWTSEHDDRHSTGDLARAAASYALFASRAPNDHRFGAGCPPAFWPWARRWWKPSDRRRALVKAGALIVAEIERHDRAPTPCFACDDSGQERILGQNGEEVIPCSVCCPADTFLCPICGGHDDDRQLMCEACGGVGMLGTLESPPAPVSSGIAGEGGEDADIG